MKVTHFGPDGMPIALGGWSTGVVSLNSNVEIVGGGPQALNFVQRITADTSNTLLNPIINFATGSNILFTFDAAAASNTLRIHSTSGGAGGGGTTITTKDEGSTLSSSVTTLDFVGAGVTASGAGATTTVTIPGGSGALTLLSSTTLGSAAADITVTGISASYKDLVIVCEGRSATASAKALECQFGAGSVDSGSNYWYVRTYTGSLAGGSSSSTSATFLEIGNIPGSGSTAGYAGSTRMEVMDYASTSRSREIISQAAQKGDDGTFGCWVIGGWQNVSGAIDRIKVFASAGNLDTGTTLYIYGRG